MQVVTNNFGVEYGRTSGATVNYVTKSGTNNFHGSGFEYYTGSYADSLTHLEGVQNGGSGVVPRFVENRWGGTLGGPIVPNKIFFFTSFMQDTQKGSSSPSVTPSITPTPAGLAALATCYPGNQAVAALTAIGPYAVAQGGPQPLGSLAQTLNLGGAGTGLAPCSVAFDGVSRSLPAVFNDYEAVARVDFALSPRDQFFVRYLFTEPTFGGSDSSAVGQFGDAGEGGTLTQLARNQQIALDWTRNWTSHLVNQVRFSYVREVTASLGGAYPACSAGSVGACPTFFNMTGGIEPFGLGVNLPQAGTTNNSQWQDNASWQHGRHLVKFGGEYDRQRAPNFFLPFVSGMYTVSPDPSLPTDATATQVATSTFNNLLVGGTSGNPLAVNLTAGNPNIPFKEQDASLYLGDDWRIKDNLTLNLGIRWEFNQQGINLLAAQTLARQLNPATRFWNPALPLNVTSVPQVPNHYDHFAPNFGFAWTPHMFEGLLGHDKTVIRGGFRLAYDPEFYNIFLNVATAAPSVNAGSFTCTSPCPIGITSADVQAALTGFIPTGGNPGARNNTRVTNSFTNPYAEEWTLGIQREITSKIAAEVRYLGTHTVHEFQTVNGNPQLCASRGAGGSCVGGLFGTFPSLVPAGVTPCATSGTPGFTLGYGNCNFTKLRLRENGVSGHYNSLQSQLKFQAWHGFTAVAAYTFSKNEDNASEIFSQYGAAAVAGPQNPFCSAVCERGLSALDFPNVFSLAWQYQLPYHGATGGLGRVLGGWALGGDYRYVTGQLWTPVEASNTDPFCNDGFNNSFFAASACRPFAGNVAAPVSAIGKCTNAAAADCGLVDAFSGAATTASAVHWILNNATSAKFFGTPYGNVRRNPGVRGQSVNTVNLNLIKNTHISEKVNFRLEANLYNALNHMFLGVPAAKIADGAGVFGTTNLNDSGGISPDTGTGSANAVGTGLAQRRLVLGAHIIF